MCAPTTCKQCGKTTWKGCGQHVDDVRRQVPADRWCGGHADEATDATPSKGFLSRLLGR